jgi:shikimate dehydrogenase
VLGAGGSARAIVYALRSGGAAEIRVASRRGVKLPGADHALGFDAAALLGADLVVSCVPPQVAPPELAALAATTRIVDLTYGPPSAVAKAARGRGLTVQDGSEMLVRQGVRAFELWTGRAAPIEVMRRAILAC